MTAIYTPPSGTNIPLVINDSPYIPPISTNITINLLVLTGPVPNIQNAAFLVAS